MARLRFLTLLTARTSTLVASPCEQDMYDLRMTDVIIVVIIIYLEQLKVGNNAQYGELENIVFTGKLPQN